MYADRRITSDIEPIAIIDLPSSAVNRGQDSNHERRKTAWQSIIRAKFRVAGTQSKGGSATRS